MKPKKFDVIVIGGGIIGISCAYELAKQGYTVAVLEKHHCGSGASGRSAAMLEFQMEAHRGEPFLSLAKASKKLFPYLHAEIKNTTGIDFQYEQCGILQLASTPEEAIILENEVIRQTYHDFKATWYSQEDLKKSYPDLTEDHCGGAFFAQDGQVNGEKFMCGMTKAARHEHVKIFEDIEIAYFEKEDNQIKSIVTNKGYFMGSKIIVAAGAWSDQVLGMLGIKLGIEPIKGQLLMFNTPEPSIKHPIYTKSGGYYAPKKDGYTFIGSTIERVGFDESITEDARYDLMDQTEKLVPNLTSKKLRRITAGLRPGSFDDLPFIGPLENHPNLIVAAGHYRRGIMLAPITAKIISALVQGKQLPIDITPFFPHRAQMSLLN